MATFSRILVSSINRSQQPSLAEDGHQMYSGNLIVSEASLIDRQIWPTSLLIFTRAKSANFGLIFLHHSTLSRQLL